MTTTPDKQYSDRRDNSLRPSWTENGGYVNEEHRKIFEKAKDIPGWQADGDAYKLYEMAYFAGEVILEIGTFGGRSAVVEICGSLSRGNLPQFFGIDNDLNAIRRTYDTLKHFDLAGYALLYHGTMQGFMKDFSIQPTMCFVDGDHHYDGVRRDLVDLSKLLRPGVPVLFHDYLNPENDSGEYGIRKAATEWESDEYVSFYGVFGCSALFVTTQKCEGRLGGLSLDEFFRRRDLLLKSYGLNSLAAPYITYPKPSHSVSFFSHLWQRIADLSRKRKKLD